ncbi:HNH endonuclease [Cellulomonas fimi]|uniref:HNH endonuclease n=1 Tax=Cellulomonas fimi TaxID=1708 RepID=UPI00234C2669|nr:HNH endonuclease [Cellulomonas fimi]MDC7123310.1 HNH endonuclease [Cellulomonas fimi]
MSGVLVLNAGYEPLHRVSLQHAVRMLHRRVAVVEEAVAGKRFGQYPLPAVLRLVRYVQMRWRHRAGAPPWSRAGVLRRDGHVCAYCGTHGASTVDHVMPRSRTADPNTWLNTVACCGRCNNRKRDRTPDEAGMRLRYAPRVPSHAELLDL